MFLENAKLLCIQYHGLLFILYSFSHYVLIYISRGSIFTLAISSRFPHITFAVLVATIFRGKLIQTLALDIKFSLIVPQFMFYVHFRYGQFTMNTNIFNTIIVKSRINQILEKYFHLVPSKWKTTFVFHVSVKKNHLNIELIKKTQKFFKYLILLIWSIL